MRRRDLVATAAAIASAASGCLGLLGGGGGGSADSDGDGTGDGNGRGDRPASPTATATDAPAPTATATETRTRTPTTTPTVTPPTDTTDPSDLPTYPRIYQSDLADRGGLRGFRALDRDGDGTIDTWVVALDADALEGEAAVRAVASAIIPFEDLRPDERASLLAGTIHHDGQRRCWSITSENVRSAPAEWGPADIAENALRRDCLDLRGLEGER